METPVKKLTLNKERIAHLSQTEMRQVIGGMAAEEDMDEDADYEYYAASESSSTALSTVHSFTCSWCMKIKITIKHNPSGVSVSGTT